jgi:endonuclease/exonuclease/phosphatase family metal-dependent hydrolase
LKSILLSLFLLLNVFAADTIVVKSWNLLHLSQKTLQKKDTQFISKYFRKNDYDVFVVEEVLDNKALSKLTTKKVLYSRRSGRGRYKEYIAFVVSDKYRESDLRVFTYYDTHDTFERDPAMLAVGKSWGVVGVHLYHGKRKNGNVELTKREIRALANMLRYFSKKSGIPEKRIIIAGDFNLPTYKIRKIIPVEQEVLIEEGTTVSTSKRKLAAHDYDHFIISKGFGGEAFVDYEVLGFDKSVKRRKWFRKRVSDHYPIVLNFSTLPF